MPQQELGRLPGGCQIAIVTRSESLRAVLDRVDTAARSDTSILLIGETGVGKELFADYIHRVSPRWNRPLVKISLSAVPHDLRESDRRVLSYLVRNGATLTSTLYGGLDLPPERIDPVLVSLAADGFIIVDGDTIKIT